MNYIGSKYTLLTFLSQKIEQVVGKNIQGMSFCDLFAGTGAVGRHFKKKGCHIIANDLQYYAYVLNRHYIGNHTPLTFERLDKIVPHIKDSLFGESRAKEVCTYLNQIPPMEGFIYRNYCQGHHNDNEDFRLYFSNENGAKCDAIRTTIEQWKEQHLINDDEYFFLLTSLLEGIDKVANTASVYGAYLKKLKKSAIKSFELRPVEVIENDQSHEIYNEDAIQLIGNINTDILYLDPPYNQRQYSANYHVLETIAKYDFPLLQGKTGMRDCSEQKSDFCNRKKVLQAFEHLINSTDAKYIFLSYNNEGLMSFQDIQRIMSKRGEYGVFSQKYNRFKADKESDNRHIAADYTTEYLHYVKVTE